MFEICPICYWEDDDYQIENPDYAGGANDLSFNQAREEWTKKIKAMNDDLKCPVCGQYQFKERGMFEICPVCDWEDDDCQMEDPDLAGGANDLSLNQARAEWAKKNK